MIISKASPDQIYPVILCGGAGTRLWPLSRESFPKQFHRLIGERTLFETTVLCAAQLPNAKSITVICNEAHRFMAAQQVVQALSSIASTIDVNIVLEPVARNTAAAIAAVAHGLPQDATMVVLPSDHHMKDKSALHRATALAVQGAAQGLLCTFGIAPTHPETGYGYIEAGEPISGTQARRVQRFIEKPNLERAKALLAAGGHFWNGGMFVMRAADYLSELAIYAPLVHSATQSAVEKSSLDLDFKRLSKDDFEKSPNISVDYAVFEQTRKAVVVAYDGDWSDVGSWKAVSDLSGPLSSGSDDRVFIDAHNNYVHANKPVVLIGVDDLVLVDAPDALLIAHKNATQNVKEALNTLKTTHPELATHHCKEHRPWGWYNRVDKSAKGVDHQVKRIHVYPGASLSLQSHAHRAEHWVIVLGNATIGLGKDLASVKEQDYSHGQHVYIPRGHIHRLTNRTTEPVEIIEVQCGSYLGEDDIVRYQDVYGRA